MPTGAATPIRITLNGRTLTSDVAPVMQSGRTLVPFRTIFEALGANVDYDPATDTVFGFKGPVFVILNPGKTTAWVSGKEVQLDVGPSMINGRTLVPTRFVAEALGATVNYVSSTNTVVITSTPDVPLPKGKAAEYTTIYSGEVTTMNYLAANSTNDQSVGANVVDTLVEYDPYGVLRPALAKYWKISADGLTYTFTLRQGVKWVDYNGTEYADVVAQDFVDAAKWILTKSNGSTHANQYYGDLSCYLKGAEDYYKGVTTNFSTVGLKALDKYTLQYTLEKPIPYFMSMLTYVAFYPVSGQYLTQQGAKFGTDHKTLLYNGPYILKNFEPQNIREFVKNEKYWDKGNVYLTKLTYKYNKEASTLAPTMFFRGEISYADIPTSVLDAYLLDPKTKDQIAVGRTSPSYSYWYAFNFDPRFDAQYEPENWKVAVHNLNFRKAIMHAFDRVAAMMTYDPYNPEALMINTITPPNFASAGGTDFTKLPALATYTNSDFFDKALAVQFKNKAVAELKGKVTFPVKVMMPYRADWSDWTNRAQVMEQQLESALGKDFIDIIPVGFPGSGFLNATRRPGNYAIQEVNWGADFADPVTYAAPFAPGDPYKYTTLAQVPGYENVYKPLIEAANAELTDMNRRYELLAYVEAWLIEQAVVIPYRTSGGGYFASKVDPLSGPYAPFGSSVLRNKYRVVLEKSRSAAEYKAAIAQWEKDRAVALKKAGQ